MMFKYEPYQAKNVLYRFDKIDSFYNARYALNPYRGCQVGCRYCYVQEKKHSDSTGFEEEKIQVVQIKINAPYLLRRKLSSGIEEGMIVLGESCEPYSEVEDEFFITRRLLEVLKDYDHPVHIITRYDRVLRDVDLIKEINRKSFACITISVPVVSRVLAGRLEGKSLNVKARLKAIKMLRKAGLLTGVAVSPVIPYISDGEEVRKVLKKAADYGASYVLYCPLSIKSYQREMFFNWLKEKYPRLIEPYERLYGEDQWPDEDYREKFLIQFKRSADLLNLNFGLPYSDVSRQGYYQELLKI
ncbi:MAG: hypothetical protein JXJ19_00810 [Elusimicrobia bacterium]|nr:hypothetical protein [Elusimicrobiota bacterium]